MENMLSKIALLNKIGVALSSEKDNQCLMEQILNGARKLTGADGGTLYTLNEQDELVFEIVSTASLNIQMGGSSGVDISFPALPLHIDGKPNESMVVTHAVLKNETININDAYDVEGYDFSGTRQFDERTDYRTQSILTIPMCNHKSKVIGVLQLINSLDDETGEVKSFLEDDQSLAESLASQAAVALTNKRLIDEQKALFESFIKLIATAIDEKSPYTGGHCRRLPDLTMMIAEACSKQNDGPLKDFSMQDSDRYELMIAGWLHDCGKVTTPEYVIDKATKLETIFDRIHLIETRFEVLKRDAEIDFLKQQLSIKENTDTHLLKKYQKQFSEKIFQLDDDLNFIRCSNSGGEFMPEEDQQRIHDIAAYTLKNAKGKTAAFLSADEIKNLTISRGTLTADERRIINNHIVVTIKMLAELPFPAHLKNVPEYAGGHHERMDGKGYPLGLKREQMSWQARMMGIADIFEALSARDRPYKKGKSLTECLRILGFMKQDHHIDPDIFDVFIREKIYLQYAEEFLHEEQIDDVEHSKIPGFDV